MQTRLEQDHSPGTDSCSADGVGMGSSCGGGMEIDTPAAERALRAVARGRKHYRFAGADTGGDRAAAIYRLLGSAQSNGLDPQAYLREVLTGIADHPSNRIEELRPWNGAAHLPPETHAAEYLKTKLPWARTPQLPSLGPTSRS